jgi:hypothetical protein
MNLILSTETFGRDKEKTIFSPSSLMGDALKTI